MDLTPPNVQSLDDIGTPNTYSLCEDISACNYYKKATVGNTQNIR